jgi:alpha-beta hydrolase superfamily lysophospholipase
VDYGGLPAGQRYAARDGGALAYRHYPAASMPSPAGAARRIVLVHGSSASSRSMHPMAQALAGAGFVVDALDIRGHGDSGPRGQSAYLGQLEDDMEDFMRAVPHAGPNTLLGFSSGGGFVLRVAGSTRQRAFDHYVLLSPYLRYDAPTARPANGDWVSVGIPRVVALSLLNGVGITAFNHLTVTEFALNAEARKLLTPSYSFALAATFGPHRDYQRDIAQALAPMQLLAGVQDQLFDAGRFASTFAQAGKTIPVTLIAGIDHIGLTLQPAALQAIVAACKAS